jgi:hypothetical protein
MVARPEAVPEAVPAELKLTAGLEAIDLSFGVTTTRFSSAHLTWPPSRRAMLNLYEPPLHGGMQRARVIVELIRWPGVLHP